VSLWSFLLAAVGIYGLYLAGKKNVWGWAVGVFAQVMWIIFSIVTEQYGFIISAVAYATVYAKNFLAWRKEK
jgi:hypothetical protein